jgi:hypothetical protein
MVTMLILSVPWNLSIRYSLNYSGHNGESQNKPDRLIFQATLSLTPRWKIQFTSGYDFEAMDFTMTNINFQGSPLLGYAFRSSPFWIEKKLELFHPGKIISSQGSEIPYNKKLV